MHPERYAVSIDPSVKISPELMQMRMNIYLEQVHNVALDMFGKRHKKVLDWFEPGLETNNLQVPSQQ